jgi:hypothetical protein
MSPHLGAALMRTTASASPEDEISVAMTSSHSRGIKGKTNPHPKWKSLKLSCPIM